MFDKLPPHNADAEIGLLACLMLAQRDKNEVALAEMRAGITPDSFNQADNGLIFHAACTLIDANRPLDVITLREELMKRDLLDQIGGGGYLAVILAAEYSWNFGPRYAEIVRDKYALRQTIALCNATLQAAYAPGAEAGEVAGELVRGAASLATNGRATIAVSLEEVLHEVYDQATTSGQPMLPVPFDFLESWLGGGFADQDFVIVAGWPSHGKSAFCKQIAQFLAWKGYAGGIVSLEESRHKIARNILSAESGVSNSLIRSGGVNGEAGKLSDAIAALAGQKLYIEDSCCTIADVTTAISLGVAKQGWRWAVVDHLDLVDIGRLDAENETQRHGQLSRSLKLLARRLHIPIFAVKQLRKLESGSRRKPTPHDLRQSGSYHADADVILFIDSDDVHHRDDTSWTNTRKTSVIGAKIREGTGGIRLLDWDGSVQRFTQTFESPFGQKEAV